MKRKQVGEHQHHWLDLGRMGMMGGGGVGGGEKPEIQLKSHFVSRSQR